jgi:hypothetical protein
MRAMWSDMCRSRLWERRREAGAEGGVPRALSRRTRPGAPEGKPLPHLGEV